jgi:carboxymethylenebutenolidase
MAEFTSQDVICPNRMPGYLALPKADAKVPGVIILHERYGFVQHPRDVADRFARLGMAGFAINGFFDCDFQERLADGSRRYYFSDPQCVDYLNAAIEALRATSRVEISKIAALGMCQTGRHPLVMAAETSAIAAAVCWYGAGSNKEFEVGPYFPTPLADILARVNCPVLGLFGDSDRHIPLTNVRTIRDLLERNGKSFQIHVYEDSPHGFLNNTMPERYRHAQSEAAWRVQMEFLEKAFSGGFHSTRAIQRYDANIPAENRNFIGAR